MLQCIRWQRWAGALSILLLPTLAACRDGSGPAAVVVSWTTASEVGLVGFNLYRSDRPDGEYVRVNPQLIPGSNDAVAGGSYQYRDSEAVAGQTYYYKLEDIAAGGSASLHGPIAVAAARLPYFARDRLPLLGAGLAGLLLPTLALRLIRRRPTSTPR
ncbi:MAG: hypothetical protein HY784_01395 [Chloroflexi bacterium]|nr:hypothetical protein [Chloroflexota bacterium]